ncbi:DNA polymerase III subunit delta' [Paracoccus aminophilus]|uniref:DNA polymerase III subunit delta n=1 Tax=Paracoccus aminophilus JCM 7686 TaxID=1367847 RepID=S5XKW6_PARAH|nr:DNA polymerase III subunit delta' [Paracoccus aminophilus]AGT07859.1 DNA polymerase III subunit delta' [Paracoccus aminophilus JCM 7686]
MSEDELPEADRVPGAPHPRHASEVIGHAAAIESFLTAAHSGRLHHGWLITGPRGTGKATLAWALARWLLSEAPGSGLQLPPDDPVLRRIAALSEPRLSLIRRPVDEKTGRLRSEITVEEIRRLLSFFHMSAAEGGRRIAIIDAADDMNPSAANALLKILEEPPKGAVIFLISHQPARLLPTIRSRCRELRLSPLSTAEIGHILAGLDAPGDPDKLAALSGGSVGEALRLTGQDGIALYQRIVDLFEHPARMDRRKAAAIADLAAGRPGASGDPFDLTMTLLDRFLSRAAIAGLLGPPLPEAAEGEAEVLARMSPDDQSARIWATAQAELSARARTGRAVNLDPSALVLDMLIGLANQPAT